MNNGLWKKGLKYTPFAAEFRPRRAGLPTLFHDVWLTIAFGVRAELPPVDSCNEVAAMMVLDKIIRRDS